MDGAAAEPAPDAADDGGVVVAFDHQDGAGGAAAPAHLAELVGLRVVPMLRFRVRHSDSRLQYNRRRDHAMGTDYLESATRRMAGVGSSGSVG